ncbi:Rpn family recombination-promoting nuclease/putative transposase, partial [Candidatus Woesearchaeota archaeon]|nr:Rpn family recombination-promoting nuclease/putative transposase [Candidatus Woesearchaeota archaeon]
RGPELLPDLINAVRTTEKPVTVQEILNPAIDPVELSGKFIILDLIEMQVRRFPAWGSRSLFYLSRLLSQQLDSGHDYARVKPVVGIHLLDFDLFTRKKEQKQALWCFEMRDAWQPTTRLCQDMQLNLVELRKAERLGLASEALKAWVTFFEHWNEEEKMANIHHEPVHRALECLKHLSADAETRRLAFVRERALRDEVALRRMDREEGREEGREAGLEEALERLIKHGLSETEARRLLDLDIREIH